MTYSSASGTPFSIIYSCRKSSLHAEYKVLLGYSRLLVEYVGGFKIQKYDPTPQISVYALIQFYVQFIALINNELVIQTRRSLHFNLYSQKE